MWGFFRLEENTQLSIIKCPDNCKKKNPTPMFQKFKHFMFDQYKCYFVLIFELF